MLDRVLFAGRTEAGDRRKSDPDLRADAAYCA
jgi:hypothetical protein